jgi:hypothetical protein
MKIDDFDRCTIHYIIGIGGTRGGVVVAQLQLFL